MYFDHVDKFNIIIHFVFAQINCRYSRDSILDKPTSYMTDV